MCVRLAGFLRSSLGLGDRANIPLSEELALARSYLEVEQVRFGARLRVEEEIEPECEACGVPALLLQPLVENAVKHGVAGLVEGGAIRLTARRRGAAVAITLENAFDPEASAPAEDGHRSVARAPAAAGSLRRRRRVRGRSQRRRLPCGPAVSLRIAHGIEQPRVTGAADRQARAIG